MASWCICTFAYAALIISIFYAFYFLSLSFFIFKFKKLEWVSELPPVVASMHNAEMHTIVWRGSLPCIFKGTTLKYTTNVRWISFPSLFCFSSLCLPAPIFNIKPMLTQLLLLVLAHTKLHLQFVRCILQQFDACFFLYGRTRSWQCFSVDLFYQPQTI